MLGGPRLEVGHSARNKGSQSLPQGRLRAWWGKEGGPLVHPYSHPGTALMNKGML